MIRSALYAWLSGVGLVFGAAAVAPGPNPAAQPRGSAAESPAATVAAPAPLSAPVPTPATQPARLAQPRGAAAHFQASDPAAGAAGLPPDPQLPLPQPAAPAPMPVSVQFDGVSPSQIVGDRVNLDLATAGNINSYVWTVMPPGTIGLKVYESGAKADFTSRFPGTYVFLIAVAGVDGSVAQAYHALELRADYSPPAQAAPVQAAPAQAAIVPRPAASDPSALVRQWTAEVKSLNRRTEQLQIASGFRQAAGAIDAGMFSGGDLFAQTKALCAMSLGGALGVWAPWFDKVEQLYREFERLKVLSTPANFSAANKSVARALETLNHE